MELNLETENAPKVSEQGTELDLKALDRCLQLLPVHEVLGIEEEFFLAGKHMEGQKGKARAGPGSATEAKGSDAPPAQPMQPPTSCLDSRSSLAMEGGNPMDNAASSSAVAASLTHKPSTAMARKPRPVEPEATPPTVSKSSPSTAATKGSADDGMSGGKGKLDDIEDDVSAFPGAMPAMSSGADDELDALLQLSGPAVKSEGSEGSLPAQPGGDGGAQPAGNPRSAPGPKEGESIDDWLNSL
mmetsp:Transcript_846/g.2536  ORF Transcript_846/g.2536 Transcript_846/m.2536 type:complete len:243 (-) Transcript_846:1466-2194(-)